MPDGSVLAADPLAQVLLRIDLETSTADTLGRVGPGPQEYEQPDQVFPLPGDSTLLVDLGKMQLTEIGPDGSFGGGIPMALPGWERFPIVLHPRFVDDQGRLFDQAGRSRDGGPPDSAAVTRYDRATRALDTVGTVWLPEMRQTRSRGGGYVPRMLEASDAWSVGPDGRIAIVRAHGFSVEWRFPDGRVVVGPPNHMPTHRVRRRDQEAVLAEMRNSGISMTAAASRDGGVSRMTMSRGLFRGGDAPGIDDYEWAETLPGFRQGGARVSPKGELWVERYLPVDSAPRMMVFDEKGLLRGSVHLPPRRQLIGFGEGPGGADVAYLVRTDEFDLQWLERYRVVR
jgi:hypothetical protein